MTRKNDKPPHVAAMRDRIKKPARKRVATKGLGRPLLLPASLLPVVKPCPNVFAELVAFRPRHIELVSLACVVDLND